MSIKLLFIKIFFFILLSETCFSGMYVQKPLDDIETILRDMSFVLAPSGFEDDMRNFLLNLWGPKSQDVTIDRLGNVYFAINSKINDTSKPTIVLMSHMDEVGLMVSSITEDGYIRFQPLGGWFETTLVTQKWLIKTDKGDVVGFTGFEAPHLCDNTTYPSVQKMPIKKMFIDVGARSKQEAEKMGILPGLSITPYPLFKKIGPFGRRYLTKALDDRVALLVIDQVIDAIQGKELDVNVVVIATVQEEVGMRGARVVANTVKPDILLNIEVSMSNDFPLQVADQGEGTQLGARTAFIVFDGSMLPDKDLLAYFINHAKENNFTYQFDAIIYYGQDGASVQTMLNGVSAINIGIPCRYAHTHGGVVDRFDIDETIKILTSVLLDLNQDKVNKIITKGVV